VSWAAISEFCATEGTVMMSLTKWKKVQVTLILSAATAIAVRAQTFETLLDFDDTDGANPTMSLVQGLDGALYGTTFGGGENGGGTIFRIAVGDRFATIYNFCGELNCADGFYPRAGLALASNGEFYGAASAGGPNQAGTIFKTTPQGALTTLYSFCSQPGCSDGDAPSVALSLGEDNNFYGTTAVGGAEGSGTVFAISLGGALNIVYSFQWKNGSGSMSPLLQASDGYFYGTSVSGQRGSDYGVVFRVSPNGKFAVVHKFMGYPTDGFYPSGGLILKEPTATFMARHSTGAKGGMA
jgi:uncharacterized repeat protein (TIGR03803 family)